MPAILYKPVAGIRYAQDHWRDDGRSARTSPGMVSSGMWMADILPHTSQMADDICLINSMWTDHPNHDNALYKIQSGRLFMGYQTLGAWNGLRIGFRESGSASLRRTERSARPAQEWHFKHGRPASCRRSIREPGFARQDLRF